MKKSKLKEILFQETDKIAASKSFEEWVKVNEPITYESGTGKNWYQVEIQILERNSEYIHISVAVDDGSFLRSIFPLSTGFIVYSDGRIDK